MVTLHPYLAELRAGLTRAEMFVPRLQRPDIPGEVSNWVKEPPDSSALAAKIVERVKDAGGPEIHPTRAESQLRAYLTRAWNRERDRENPTLFSKWAVKTVNDTVARVVADLHGLRMDYVTFRAAFSLLKQLHVACDARSLAGRTGWTLWETSAGVAHERPADKTPAACSLEGPVWIKRRLVPAEEGEDHHSIPLHEGSDGK